MTASVRVPINGETLAWARSSLGLEVDALARAAAVSPEQAIRFEVGEVEPTLPQLRKIAAKLDRPLAFFFTSVPETQDVPVAADFRARGDGDVPPILLREMKRAAAHRDTFIELSGHPTRPLQLSPVTWETVEKCAQDVREQFGFGPDFRPPSGPPSSVFNYWRDLFEDHGILVFQTTGVSLSTFRGLSIDHDVIPLIILNGADSANGKIFTLFHELGHLSTHTSGLCMLEDRVDVEALCNAFAANALMPREVVNRVIAQYTNPVDAIEALALQFRVSPLAAAVRLKALGLITADQLERRRKESDETWELARKRQAQSDGFVPIWTLRYRDLGPTYVSAVLGALQTDRLNYVDASYLLNARIPTIERMQQELHRRGGA